MNRAFYLVLAPALLVGIFYWQLGYRPSWRAVGGLVAMFTLALMLVQRQRRARMQEKAQTNPAAIPAGDAPAGETKK